jgi:ferredoxin
MRIKINREKCIGCGTCAALAPEAFKINGDFKAKVKEGADPDSPAVRDAIKSCPVEAISVE